MADWAIWTALIVVVFAGIASLVLFVVRARRAWPSRSRSRSSQFLRAALDGAIGTVGRVTAYLPHE